MSIPRTNPQGFWHNERNLTRLMGNWVVGAVGAVGVVTGNGFAVTRTGAGDYLLTFTDAFAYFLCGTVNVSCISGAAVDIYGQFGAFTPGGTGAATLQIRTETGAADTDPTATDSVVFECVLYGETLDA